MVAMSDSARLDRAEDAIRELRTHVSNLASGALHFNEIARKNDEIVIERIASLAPWLNAVRVLLEDIHDRLSAMERK